MTRAATREHREEEVCKAVLKTVSRVFQGTLRKSTLSYSYLVTNSNPKTPQVFVPTYQIVPRDTPNNI
jgi:hypothetical protein